MKGVAFSALASSLMLFALLPSQSFAKWEKMSESKDTKEAFKDTRVSFDIHKNWNYCTRNTVKVGLIPGKEDYEETFKQAFKMLEEANGGSIKLEAGVYVVSGPVKIPEKCCIRGVGMSKTIIRLKKKAKSYFTGSKMKGILHCSKSRYVTVHSLTVDGNRKEQNKGSKYHSWGRYGLSFERCNYAWFRNVRAVRNEHYGFFTRGVKGDAGYHAFHEGVQADDNGLDGIKLRSLMYGSVANSVIRDNERHGVYITGRSGKILLYNDRLWNNGKCGFMSAKEKGYTPKEMKLEKITVEKANTAGICIDGGEDTVIEKSMVRDSGSCYKLKTSKRVVIEKTKCEGKRFKGQYEGDKCEEAIVEKGVCCPLKCGQCGGKGCSSRGDFCCVSDIKKTKRSCDKNKAPCVM